MENSYDYLVGYGRVDITPTESVPLGGYGSSLNRMSWVVRDPIFASCIAVTDKAGNTVLLTSMDLISANPKIVDLARETIEKLLGIPGTNVMIAGTHTHASVDTYVDVPQIRKYIDDVGGKLIPAAAAIAMADRRPAKLYMGETEPEGMNFVRHYKANPTDGTEPFYFGDNHNDYKLNKDLVQNHSEHVSEIYRKMHIVKFERENDKDILFVNWRAHVTQASNMIWHVLSADFVGDTRKIVEDKTDYYFTYFQGAAGNVNSSSRIEREMRTSVSKESVAYSQALSDIIIKGAQNLRYVEPADIKVTRTMFEGRVNHTKDHLAEKAAEISKFFRESGDRPAANQMARDLGLHSVYEASAVAAHANMPQTKTIELDAVRMGDLALVTAPNELFDVFSVVVEGKAPYEKVLTLGYCNSSAGYIPSAFGYEYGCYESDTTIFAPGTLEDVEEACLEMLNKLK